MKKAIFFLVLIQFFYLFSQESDFQPVSIFTEGADSEEIQYCLQKGRINISEENLCKMLKDSAAYRAYIRYRLQKENVPACIEYLPIIESSYKPTAKPVNGVSVGMWQFMPNSVAPFMELSDYVDQRRDPWISTDAAIAKLKDNYRVFGNWLLALAAYNCGAGAVKRALEKASHPDYKTICEEKLIPDHAIAYVPNFLKVADFIINSAYYENEKIKAADELEDFTEEHNRNFFPFWDFEYVETDSGIYLKELAAEMRIDYDYFYRLNLSLIKQETPPGKTYFLRVPSGMKQACIDAIYTINNRK